MPNIDDGDAKSGDEDAVGVGERANGLVGEDERRMSVPIFQGVDGARLHSVVHANFTTSCRQADGVLQS